MATLEMKRDVLVPARAGLNLPGKLTKTAWQLPADIPFEQWKAIGIALTEIGAAVAWWIGDWWVFGEHAYGDRLKAAREGIFGSYTFQALMDIGWVCRSIATSLRSEVLEFGHHRLVAPLAAKEQQQWLERAARGEWTIQQLRGELFKWKLQERHRAMAGQDGSLDLATATFSLIYADPPWKRDTYSLLGKETRSAERHYPTMDSDAIAEFRIAGRPVRDIADRDAGLFLWCTSSNIQAALEVMLVWGFPYKTQAVWDKQRHGTGYVFLNQHEILLYGSRGNFPMPLQKVSSVFSYKRGKHSAKPPEIRAAIESMYPRMTSGDRLELFARGKAPGWTVYGFESEPLSVS
jgi:N6-adenosine-specific RNA methylase IME4